MINSTDVIIKNAKDCLQSLQALKAILEKEKLLLEQGELDLLDDITNEKSQLLSVIESQQKQVLSRLEAIELQQYKVEILTLAQTCKALNESNNAIIQTQQQFIKQKIHLLFGYEDESSNSYSPTAISEHKHARHSQANNIIGKA